MENKKLKTKDLVNIGVFSAIYMIISIIFMLPAAISPILWMAYPAIAGIFCGTIYMLLMAKVQKKGTSLIMGLITALIYFAIGECTWLIVVTFGVTGIISEIIRSSYGYQNLKGNVISCGILTIGFVGSPLPMWIFHDSYVKSIIKMGMDPIYVEQMSKMVSTGSLIGMIVIAFIGGIIGAIMGKKLLKKHFVKAGII